MRCTNEGSTLGHPSQASVATFLTGSMPMNGVTNYERYKMYNYFVYLDGCMANGSIAVVAC